MSPTCYPSSRPQTPKRTEPPKSNTYTGGWIPYPCLVRRSHFRDHLGTKWDEMWDPAFIFIPRGSTFEIATLCMTELLFTIQNVTNTSQHFLLHRQFRFREKSEHFVGRWMPRTDGIRDQTPLMPSAWCLSVGMFMTMEKQPDMCLSHEPKDQTQPLGCLHLKFEEITTTTKIQFAYYWESYVSSASTLIWKLSLTNRFQITWVLIVSQYDNL